MTSRARKSTRHGTRWPKGWQADESTHRVTGLSVLAWVGDRDGALDLLERGLEEHEPRFRIILSVRAFDPLRGDARFERILDSAGLSDRKMREAGLLR